MSASKSDLDRVYWSLAVLGPMTLHELMQWTGWTKHRTNDALQRLRKKSCVRLILPKQYRGAPWFNVITKTTCRTKAGKWQAITECEIVEAIEVSA